MDYGHWTRNRRSCRRLRRTRLRDDYYIIIMIMLMTTAVSFSDIKGMVRTKEYGLIGHRHTINIRWNQYNIIYYNVIITYAYPQRRNTNSKLTLFPVG